MLRQEASRFLSAPPWSAVSHRNVAQGARIAGIGCLGSLAILGAARAEPPLSLDLAPPLLRGASSPDTSGVATGPRLGAPAPIGLSGFPFGAVAPPSAATRGWSITPSLGAQLLATDNLFLTSRNKQSDLVVTLTPGLFMTVDTARLQGTLNYVPSVEFYLDTPGQDRVNHFLNAQVLATVVPRLVFLDLRGNASVGTASGGFAREGAATVDKRNQVQTTAFQVSPYVLQRFGGLATVQAGYGFQYGSQNGDDAFLPGQTRPFFTTQDFTANQLYAVARTGEDFGRLALEGRASGTEYTGTGVLDSAHRYSTSVEARYALNRFLAVLGEVGYQDQEYSSTPRISISEAIWSAGGRVTPNEDSVLTVRYGHRDGFNSARADGSLALGPRTTLWGSYSEVLTTTTLRAADLLSATTLDALGNPVDAQTGAPSPQLFSDSLLGQQASLQRIRSAVLALSRSWSRDIVTLSLYNDRRRPVATAEGAVAYAQRGTAVGVTWSHEFTPATVGTTSFQYGRFEGGGPGRFASGAGRLDSSGFGSGNVYTFTASLAQRITASLTGSVQYVLTHRDNGVSDGRVTQNVILAGLRQSF